MADDLVKRLREKAKNKTNSVGDKWGDWVCDESADRIESLEAALSEMTRRRDEWRKKAEGFDAVRLALRAKVGTPWPPHMSRLLWAGIAADEKKRADDAEAALQAADQLARALELLTVSSEDDPDALVFADDTLTAYRKARGGET